MSKKIRSKLRLSFSLLQCWQTGDYDQCALMYQHKTEPNAAQQRGLDMHDKWQSEIVKTKKLVVKDRVFRFKEPKVEHEIIQDFSELSIVKGRIDCVDSDIVWEFKSGVTSSLEYAQKDQIPFYFMLLKMRGNPLSYGKVVHYNQQENVVDVSKVYYSEDLVEKAVNLCQTFEHDIYQYFDSIGIL